MKKSVLTLVTLCFLVLLTGCTVEADRIYTVCKSTEDTVYVYNAEGEFFTYKNGEVLPCYEPSLQARPKLILEFDDSTDFSFDKEMPSVYIGSKEDCLHYVTKLLRERNGKYRLLSVDWKSFEMLVTTSECDVRVLYSNDNRVRIYAQDESGGIVPPYLEDL